MYRDFIVLRGGVRCLGKIWVYRKKNEIPEEDKTDSMLLPLSAANLNKNLKAHNSLLKGHSQSDLA